MPFRPGLARVVGEVVGRDDHPADLAGDREPEVEQVEAVRGQDRGRRPRSSRRAGCRRSARRGRPCSTRYAMSGSLDGRSGIESAEPRRPFDPTPAPDCKCPVVAVRSLSRPTDPTRRTDPVPTLHAPTLARLRDPPLHRRRASPRTRPRSWPRTSSGPTSGATTRTASSASPSTSTSSARGTTRSGVDLKVENESPGVVVVDGGWGFGQVQAHRLLDLVIPKAKALGLAAGHRPELRPHRPARRVRRAGRGRGPDPDRDGQQQRRGPAGRPAGRARAEARDQPPLRRRADRRRPGRARLRHQRRRRGEGPRPLLQRQEAGPRRLAPRRRRAGRPPTRRSSTSRRSARSCRWAGTQAYKGFGLGLVLDMLSGGLTRRPVEPPGRGRGEGEQRRLPRPRPRAIRRPRRPARRVERPGPSSSGPPRGPRASPRSSCPATPSG